MNPPWAWPVAFINFYIIFLHLALQELWVPCGTHSYPYTFHIYIYITVEKALKSNVLHIFFYYRFTFILMLCVCHARYTSVHQSSAGRITSLRPCKACLSSSTTYTSHHSCVYVSLLIWAIPEHWAAVTTQDGVLPFDGHLSAFERMRIKLRRKNNVSYFKCSLLT